MSNRVAIEGQEPVRFVWQVTGPCFFCCGLRVGR